MAKINIENKTFLITGASSGLGKEFALELAKKAGRFVFVSRKRDKLEETAEQVKKIKNIEVDIIPADLTLPESPGKIFEELKEKNIHIDILINNSGFGHWGEFEKASYDKYYNMNMLNITSLVSLCHLFIPPMLEKGEGGVLNVASSAGFQPLPYMANYAVTKAFVLNFSLALWQEYKDRGIVVTAFCPGHTKTKFHSVAEMPDKAQTGVTADPKVVVKEAINAFLKGEPVLVPKVHWNFLQFVVAKHLPVKMRLNITADMLKPKE